MFKLRRVLLKLSGEFLFEFNGQVEVSVHLLSVIRQIKHLSQAGVQIIAVMGGGNLCRGRSMQKSGVGRLVADNVGMLSTVINGLVFQDYLLQQEVRSRVFSSFSVGGMVPLYDVYSAEEALNLGEVIICAGGTGNPLCSTDSAASLRAIQLEADLFLKLSNVAGVYDKDPDKNKDASLYDVLTYDQYMEKNLKVMDLEACRQCKMFKIPIRVVDCRIPGVIEDVVRGGEIGTLVGDVDG